MTDSPPADRGAFDPSTLLLWLTVAFVAAGIYFYRINILLTVLIALIVSLLLGLLTLSLLMYVEVEEEILGDQASSNDS